MERKRGPRGVTLVEILVSVVILAVAIVPVYSMMTRGVRTVGRTEDHLIAYNLAEKIVEALKARLTNPATLVEAVKLETPGATAPQVLDFFKAEEDANGDGTLEALSDVLAAKSSDEARRGLKMLEKFHYSIKNKATYPTLDEARKAAKGGQDPYELVSGVTKVVTVAWADQGGKQRQVSLEHDQSLYGNFQFVIRGNYEDAPIFYGDGAEALNRAYKANLQLARSMTDDAQLGKLWIPPDNLVFRSFMFWPGDPTGTPLLKGKTRINVKVQLLAKVTGLTQAEVIDGDPLKSQTRTQLEKATLRAGLTEEEKGKGFISDRFIRSIDEMNLKCISCHSQWFFRTDPLLKANWPMYLGKDFVREYGEKVSQYKGSGNPTSGDNARTLTEEDKKLQEAKKRLDEGLRDFSGNLTLQAARTAAEIFKGRGDYVNLK